MPDFPVVFHFKVAFANSADEQDNRFQEVSGLSAEITVEEYREGGVNHHPHRLPTGTRFNNLVLKRGHISGTDVAAWCRKAVENFVFEPTDVDISLLDEKHEPLAHWSFTGAWPVKWSLSDLKAQENALAIESLELAHRGFRKVEG
jgi:phage tail-like protein